MFTFLLLFHLDFDILVELDRYFLEDVTLHEQFFRHIEVETHLTNLQYLVVDLLVNGLWTHNGL